MKHIYSRTISLFLCTAICMSSITALASENENTPTDITASAEKSKSSSYSDFLEQNQNEDCPISSIRVQGSSFVSTTDPDAKVINNLDGVSNPLQTGNSGSVEWEFDAPASGLYNVSIHYYPLKGKGIPIERTISINDSVPYDDLKEVSFQRIFRNENEESGTYATDVAGNQLRPNQIEAPKFRLTTLTGSMYNARQELKVKLNEGKNKLKLTSVKEPMAIDYIEFFNAKEEPSYKETKASYPCAESGNAIHMEGEDAALKSSAVLYPVSDRSSPNNSPSNVNKIVMNAIGGGSWEAPGQWIQWKFHVEKSGLYKIQIRGKQDLTPGSVSYRKIMIDDTVPFKEAESTAFSYSSDWQIFEPGNGDGPYQYYLSEGDHTLTLQCNVGDISDLLKKLSKCISRLNECYRSVFMITGSYPDADRDYNLESVLPDLDNSVKQIYDDIRQIKADLLKLTGSKGNGYSEVEKLEVQLSGFVKDVETIPSRLGTFKTNISNLSDFYLTAINQPLLIDWIDFVPVNAPRPEADAGFFGKLTFGLKAFIASFITDYRDVSLNDSNADKNITLWMGGTQADLAGGRDQAIALQSIVENSFTAQKKIGVKLRLVDPSVLLPAVAAGRGPDIAIGLTSSLPMNYAYRGAVYNLTNFSDFPEVEKQFNSESLMQFRYRDEVYALPDRYSFYMMFYRKDILDEMGMQIPKTWDDVYTMLPKLQNKHMEIGVPNLADNNIDLFTTFLFQKGGNVYDKDLTQSILDSDESVQAFKSWTDFYTKYKVSQKMNHLNRFRTGSAPIVFMPYNFYANLQAAAPEIKGLWGFDVMPGTVNADGSINNTVCGTSTGSLIFSNSKHKDEAWEFMKWWVSASTQAAYGNEIENEQGPAGRYQVANYEALDQLPWTSDELTTIKKAWKNTKAVPEAPGGYMTGRYIVTSASLVINNGLVPRESIINYNQMINNEVKSMRRKFGLD